MIENDKLYNIDFVGLKLGKHRYVYPIKTEFLSDYEVEEIKDADINAVVILEKHHNFMECSISINGDIGVFCDVSGEPFQMTIQNKEKIVVKFGEQYNDDEGYVIIIPHTAYRINLKRQIFDAIVLSIPMKKIHPNVEKYIDQADQLNEKENIEEKKGIDPRWEKLKGLM